MRLTWCVSASVGERSLRRGVLLRVLFRASHCVELVVVRVRVSLLRRSASRRCGACGCAPTAARRVSADRRLSPPFPLPRIRRLVASRRLPSSACASWRWFVSSFRRAVSCGRVASPSSFVVRRRLVSLPLHRIVAVCACLCVMSALCERVRPCSGCWRLCGGCVCVGRLSVLGSVCVIGVRVACVCVCLRALRCA